LEKTQKKPNSDPKKTEFRSNSTPNSDPEKTQTQTGKQPSSTLESQLHHLNLQNSNVVKTFALPNPITTTHHNLTPEMIHRYSRHLLLSSFEVKAQSNLINSSILVVKADE